MIIAETSRLLLRHFQASDRPPLLELLTDPEVMRFSMGVKSPAEVADWLATRIAEAARHPPDGVFAVCEKASAEVVGYCGLTHMDDIDGVAETELGYRLRRRHWGKGYATEAAAAVRDHAFSTLKKTRLISLIEPDNHASVRVAEKLGMTFWKEAMLPGYTHPDHIYVIRHTA